VFNQFQDSYISTIGTKVTMKELKILGKNGDIDLTLVIWDLIGREGYSALHARSFVGVSGAILVADLTRRETMNSLERYWIPSLVRVVGNVPLVFAANKSDLKGNFEFKADEISEIAKKYVAGFNSELPKSQATSYATSAKTDNNVENLFESLGYLVAMDLEQGDPVKELYESLVATKIKKTLDMSAPIGVLDAIIVDFCDGFSDQRLVMPILRSEIARAGIDIRSPSKEGIMKLIEYLAEAETEFIEEKKVNKNLRKRMEWTQSIVN
jgi:small GTP-binding protein